MTQEGIPGLMPCGGSAFPGQRWRPRKKAPLSLLRSSALPRIQACLGSQTAHVWNLAVGGGPEKSGSRWSVAWSWLSPHGGHCHASIASAGLDI